MNHFVVMNGKKLKQNLFIIVVAFITAFFLYIENIVYIPVFTTKDGPKAVYQGEKDVAITFNIGWGDEKAAPILDYLKENNIKSVTFFLSGSWAERHPDLVERMVKEGYEIGMLGYAYKNYTELEDEKIRQDIVKALQVFKKLNVKDIRLLRSPTGHFDERTLKISNNYGLTLVHWSLDSKDWTNPGTETIIKNISKATKGDIILLHASDSAKQTRNALPNIFGELSKKGLKPVQVSEMIANGKAQTKEIK